MGKRQSSVSRIPKYKQVARNLRRGYKTERTRTEIAKLNKTSRTTVYRAIKYNEQQLGYAQQPFIPIRERPPKYREYKRDYYKEWYRVYYSTPSRASTFAMIKTKKPDKIMLQAWYNVEIYYKGELVHRSKEFGVSVTRSRERFDFARAEREMRNGALMSAKYEWKPTEYTDIEIKMTKLRPSKRLPGMRTVGYFSR